MPWVKRVSFTASGPVSTAPAPAAGRSRRTASATMRTASSISGSVVPRPTEKRTVPTAYRIGTRIASSTVDSSTPAAWQAAPAEAATESPISARSVSASIPPIPTLSVLGRPSPALPFRRRSSTSRERPAHRRSRIASKWWRFFSRSRAAISQACPRPTISSTFSVPALRPDS